MQIFESQKRARSPDFSTISQPRDSLIGLVQNEQDSESDSDHVLTLEFIDSWRGSTGSGSRWVLACPIFNLFNCWRQFKKRNQFCAYPCSNKKTGRKTEWKIPESRQRVGRFANSAERMLKESFPDFSPQHPLMKIQLLLYRLLQETIYRLTRMLHLMIYL